MHFDSRTIEDSLKNYRLEKTFPEFQSNGVNQEFSIIFCKNILLHRLGNDLCSESVIKFYGDKGFVFPVEAFRFSKYYRNEAKRDKSNFKKVLTMAFKVKS